MSIKERLQAILIELREIKDIEELCNELEDIIIEIGYATSNLEDVIAKLDINM